MKILVLDYVRFDIMFRQERAHVPDRKMFRYERWSKTRKSLVRHLGKFGIPDKTGYGTGNFVKVGEWVEYDGGDFFVGDDWFELGVLSILVLHWKWLSISLIEECRKFLELHRDYIICIQKAFPRPEDMFELVVTPCRAYMGVFNQGASEAWSILQAGRQYDEIRDIVELSV